MKKNHRKVEIGNIIKLFEIRNRGSKPSLGFYQASPVVMVHQLNPLGVYVLEEKESTSCKGIEVITGMEKLQYISNISGSLN